MPCRSRWIASTKSSRSAMSLPCCASTSLQLLLGQEIDRAEPLALAADAVELAFDLGDLRQCRRASIRRSLPRRQVRHRADRGFRARCRRDGAAAPSRRSSARARFGARFADRFERGARGLVGGGKSGFALRQAVGGGAAAGGRRLDLADQRLALGGEFLRRLIELGPLGLCLLRALADGFDLRRGVVFAFVPFGTFARDRLQAAIGELGFARDRLRFDTHFGKRRAILCYVFIDLGQLGLKLGGGRQRVQRACRFLARRRPLRRGRRRCAAALLSAPRCAPRCG